ncbi:hypothetical protein SDC9_143033 [bioreactor metagenome]|uniref:Uncharacterized protein n=1 Tax=bioreactor metagenome TaxID=1076179 RepID=A0A645E2G3_9ZZZZ
MERAVRVLGLDSHLVGVLAAVPFGRMQLFVDRSDERRAVGQLVTGLGGIVVIGLMGARDLGAFDGPRHGGRVVVVLVHDGHRVVVGYRAAGEHGREHGCDGDDHPGLQSHR